MSGSAIADALVTNLGAASLFTTEGVSKNSFRILESSGSSCCVVVWGGVDISPTTFGGTFEPSTIWDFELRIFVRDHGSPSVTLTRAWKVTDDVISMLKNNPTLDSTIFKYNRFSGRYDPTRALEVSGAVWIPITFTLEVEDLT